MPERVPVPIERGGRSGPSVLLLHGSGATAAVWVPLLSELDRRGLGVRWTSVDLPGHGRSGWLPDYHHTTHAAVVAAAVSTELGRGPEPGSDPRIDLVVGHSLGALVALTLADNTYGLIFGAATAMAMKVRWTPDELSRRAALAERAPRTFPGRDPAAQRFALVSGLDAAPVADRLLDTGIRSAPEGYQLAADPAITAALPATSAELAEVMGRVATPVRVVCGDADPGIDPSDTSATLGMPVQVVPGAGHNLHVDLPAVVADVLESQLYAGGRATGGG